MPEPAPPSQLTRQFWNLREIDDMTWSKQRNAIQSILSGKTFVRPGSVYDPVSARIAADLGFEVGMLGGSTASLAVLGKSEERRVGKECGFDVVGGRENTIEVDD